MRRVGVGSYREWGTAVKQWGAPANIVTIVWRDTKIDMSMGMSVDMRMDMHIATWHRHSSRHATQDMQVDMICR